MAAHRTTLERTNKLFRMVFWAMFGQLTFALPSSHFGAEELGSKDLGSFRSVSEPTAAAPQVRLHPGLVASVVIVTIAALVAAALIIRKYCFPQSEATYRYSVLRQMEEHTSADREDDNSDQGLLE